MAATAANSVTSWPSGSGKSSTLNGFRAPAFIVSLLASQSPSDRAPPRDAANLDDEIGERPLPCGMPELHSHVICRRTTWQTKSRAGSRVWPGIHRGAGDGNRTRTFSLED